MENMVKPRSCLLLAVSVVCFYTIHISAASYGSDTTVSIVNPFNITGPVNIIRTFACTRNGFGFADVNTTCSFNSIFPVAGPIYLRGGKLYLQSDLILTNTGSLADLGTIKGQNHAVDLPESVKSFAYGTQPNGAVVMSLVSRITAIRTMYSVDWSYDGKYVAYGIASGSGSDLYIYEFTGTSLVLRASVNVASSGFSVRWRPNSYQIAVGAGSTIRTYTFIPPSTLNFADRQSPGGNYYAVSWQGRGLYLAAGGYNTTNTYIRIYSVNTSGVMSLVTTNTNNTTAQFNGTITYDVLKWAPVGNKNDLIAGSSGGSLHLYNFTGAALTHLKNYQQGTNITSLDWAPTSTYMALGFSNGTVKTYQHTASTNTIASKTTYTGSTVATRSLSWNYNAKQLAAGFNYSASTLYPECQILGFSSSTYLLSRIYNIDLGNNVSAIKYDPSGSYIARADDTTRYLSVYKISLSPFVFEDVKLYLTGNITLGSPLTFKGNCILNARSNLITVTGDGAINVAENSTLDIEQTYLNFTTPKTFALEGSTSNVVFRNTWVELGSDVVWGDGRFDSYEDLTVTGPYVFDYESAYTSTIHANSTLTFQKGATLKIGKTRLEAVEPLVFEDNAAQLTFDNATLNVTNSGLKLTKGTINIYNQSVFNIDNLDNTQSCSLTLGDSARGSSYDTALILHGNGTALNVNNGPIVLDSVSPYMNQFLGQSHILIADGCTVGIKRPIDVSRGWFSADETSNLDFAPNAYMLCYNTHFTNLLFNDRYEDYYLTGTLTAMEAINLYENNVLNLNTGILLQVINIIGSGNTITGVGRLQGELNFVDSNSEVTWDLAAPLELYDDVYLNGGRINFTQDSAFIDALTFKTTGTVDLGVYNFYLGPQDTSWNGKIYWVGNGGNLCFQADVGLSGVWTFSGDVVVNGYQKTLFLEDGGTIVLERGAHVTFKDILIEGLSESTAIVCSDDTCRITFDYTDIALAGDYAFKKGSFVIYNDTWMTAIGGVDATYSFSYESVQTSTIDEMASLKIGPRLRFTIGRADSKITDPDRQPLVFIDVSSPLILDSGTLHITSSGMIMTRGALRVQGVSTLEIDNNKYDYALILGSGVHGYDQILEINAGGQLSLTSGTLVYNNALDNRIVFDSPSSILNIKTPGALYPQTSMRLTDGSVSSPDSANFFIGYNPGAYSICSNLHRYDYGHLMDYYMTATLSMKNGLRNIVLDSNDQILINPGILNRNISVLNSENKISGIGNLTGTLSFFDYNSSLTWDLNQKYSGANVELNGGRIVFTQDSGFTGQTSFVGTGTVDLMTHTFDLGTEDVTWNGDLYWIGDGGILNINSNVTLAGTWTFSGNVVINGNNFLIDLAPSGKIVLEHGAQLSLKNISMYNVSNQNPIICSDDNCVITMSVVDILLSGDYLFDKGRLFVYWNSTIGSLGNLDVRHTFSYTSAASSNIDSFCSLRILPQTIFSIGRKYSEQTNSANQPLTFVDATSRLILENSTLHVTSSGMILTNGELVVQGGSTLEVENNKHEYSLILGDGTLEHDQAVSIEAGANLTLKTGKLVYNNAASDRIVFHSSTAGLAVESDRGLVPQTSFKLSNGSVLTPLTTDVFIEDLPNTCIIAENLHRYDYAHLLDYVVSATLALLPNRTLVLDTNDKLLTNPGTISIDISIKNGNNFISGAGTLISNLIFADYNSSVTWDIKDKYTGGNIVLNGGKIVYNQDSGLTDGYSFIGTGTVDLTSKSFELGTKVTTWHGDLYWVGDGATIRLNNDIILDGTWTLSGNITIDGGYTIDLSPSGKIVLERGAQVSIVNTSLYNLSRKNPIVCLDDNCLITMNYMDFMMAGDFEFDKGSLYVYWDSTISCLGDLDKNYTFSYTSAVGSYIDVYSRLQILPGVTFAIGRPDSTVTDPDLQPLTFGDSTSILEMFNGSTLHVTSSGMILTKGVLQINGHSILEIESHKDEYGLIIGDGTAENDFGCMISGDGVLTLESGKLVTNFFQPTNRVIFQNPSAEFELGSTAALKVKSDLTLESGYIRTHKGATVDLAPGVIFTENDVTEYSEYPYNSFKVKGRANGFLGFELDDGGYFYSLEGMHLGGIQCNAGNTRIGGVAGISDEYFGPITLVGPRSRVEMGMIAALKTDVVLNGGTVIIDSATIFAADKQLTGSGTVQVSGRQLTLGTEEMCVTNTIHWLAPVQGKLDLRAKTMLTGTWIVDGKLEINGNGNILDLSRGGSLIIRPNSTLLLDDVAVKGLGENFGNIIWDADTSLLRCSNTYVELDNNFVTTMGGIYVAGPLAIGFKNHNWIVDNTASMTVDGVTLWKDSLSSDACGKFIFGSGDQSKYLTLVSSGTIKTATNDDVINAIVGQSNLNLTTIDHGPANIHFTTDSAYTLSYDLNLASAHYLELGGQVTVDGNGHTINLAKSSGNQIVVNNNASVVLNNMKITNFSESAFTIGSNAQVIMGDGVSLTLDSAQSISRTWIFAGDTVLNGNNNTLDLTAGGNVIVAPHGNLTLHDLYVTGLNANNMCCQGDVSTLHIKDVELNMSGDYSFTSGAIQYENDVVISGSHIFAFQSNVTSTIAHDATVYFGFDTTFNYAPVVARKDLLAFEDVTSALYMMKGAALYTTSTGMQLTKGRLIVDTQASFNAEYATEGSSIAEIGITLGNNNAEDDVIIDILPGSVLDVDNGYLIYKNVLSTSMQLRNPLSTLQMNANTILKLYQNLDIGNGRLRLNSQSALYKETGTLIIGDVDIFSGV